jgi:hypothetical protein
MHCPHPKPINQALYNRIKAQVKSRVKRWPSAYASGQLVRSYKQKGGKYRCTSMGKPRCTSMGKPRCTSMGQFSFGNLDRWFKEKWVDVCKSSSSGKNVLCGRKKSSSKGYPYCRPSRRISSQTPRTAREFSKSEIKKRCAIKRKIKGKTMSFGKNKINFLNLTSTKSILSLRKRILSTQPKDCKSWNTCKSWLYFISKPVKNNKNIKKIQFTLKRKKHQIDKIPSNKFDEYLNLKGNAVSFKSPSGTLLIIPKKGYVNLMDFTFNATKKEWIDLWKKVRKEATKMKKPFYISTHGHSVNWLHVRLEKKLKF